MTVTAPDTALAIRAARLLAIRQAPYLATALLRLLLIETDLVPTMGVDHHWRVYVNPEFAATKTVEELAYVWLHEVGHCLRAHPTRWQALAQPDPLHGLFNIAGDALINADLDDITSVQPTHRVQLGRLEVPGAHRGMSVEELYRLLLQGDDPGEESGHYCGSGASGRSRSWELSDGPDDGSVDEGTAELIRDYVAEAIRSQGTGTVPAGLRRWADARVQPVVDWHKELRAVLTQELTLHQGRRDYTYARPGRRRVPGVVLPAMVDAAPPKVAVVIDTSGSMGSEDLARALTEASDLVQRLSRDRRPLRVITCDSAAHSATTVRAIDQLELVGGGGTDTGAGIQAAAQLRPHPDLIVVISDGFTPWPSAPPRRTTRVIAVLTRPDALQRVPTWIRTIDASSGTVPAS